MGQGTKTRTSAQLKSGLSPIPQPHGAPGHDGTAGLFHLDERVGLCTPAPHSRPQATPTAVRTVAPVGQRRFSAEGSSRGPAAPGSGCACWCRASGRGICCVS